MATQQDLSDFVRREVHYCVSSLVHTLAKGYGAGIRFEHKGAADIGQLCEQAAELSFPIDDWEEAARYEGWEHVETQADRCMVFRHKDGETVCHATWGELCDENQIEPYQWEIYEHWIVSDWLGRKLEAKGQRVDFDFAGLTVWGRTCTGQAIFLDSVIAEIYEELGR